MRRKISNYGDYYLPPRGDSLDLRTRVRDHIYAIDNEFSMENDPSYRWPHDFTIILTNFILRVISPRKEEIKINKRSAGEGFGLNFDTVFYIEEVVPNSLASKHHFKGEKSTI